MDENATPVMLLHTVQMLQAELQGKTMDSRMIKEQEKVAVIMPKTIPGARQLNPDPPPLAHSPATGEEDSLFERYGYNHQASPQEPQNSHPPANGHAYDEPDTGDLRYDPLEEVPTLSHQRPSEQKLYSDEELKIDYPESLNDVLKEERIELSQKLTDAPIKDLKKAIGVNDRFLFINELFRGDESMYERSIKTIQNFSILAEAEYWIRRELKIKIGWMDTHPVVKQFDQLVRRRFA
ncbi:MAG: hypothetical protein KGM98_11190 [Bacteroidota bacterium]|nr:hypothetical protein [Bacteroidota bacterium]